MSALARGYEVKVAGHLDDHWSDWLGGFTITRHPDGTSTLTGTATDQAQLHGVLAGLRDVGVELLCLHTVDPVDPVDPVEPGSPEEVDHRPASCRTASGRLRSP